MLMKRQSPFKVRQRIIFPSILALSILVVGILSISPVAAQDYSGQKTLIQKISEKFGLPEAEVQLVFDDYRDEKRAEMYAMFGDRLDELVSENKLTEEQKEVLLNKHEEMLDKLESLGDLEPEVRKEEVRKLRGEFKNWAKEEGLELNSLGLQGFRLGHGAHKLWRDKR